jgi:sugar phosphate isomerase/epimerase
MIELAERHQRATARGVTAQHQEDSVELGFKVDGLLAKYGRRPGAGENWSTAAAAKELQFWRDQGFRVVELTADIYSETGAFFQYSDDEWRIARRVVEDGGLRFHSVLGWRRMICREPWVAEKLRDLDRIAAVSEILGLKVIDIMVAYPMRGSAQGVAGRSRFRSLWDATEADFTISAERLKPYARQIASFGASLSLEIHEDTLHDTARSALRLVELIDEPNVGINPDTMDNWWLFPGEAVPDAITQMKQVAPRVNHWHVKQYQREVLDGAFQMLPSYADEGSQPLDAYAQILVNAGYQGAAILECGRGANGAYTMKRFVDYFRWLLDVYIPNLPSYP